MANGAVSYSDGEDAEALAAEMGLDLIPWQRPVLYDLCARDERDRPAYVTAGLSVPRQNGKNAILEAFELYVLAVCGWHVLHTAHRVKTTKKSFRRLVRYFTDKRHPDVCALVESIRYTNGEEAIYLTNGGSIEFSARSRVGNRGFDDIQLVVFDEAQELTDDQMNAIMYTISASSTGERMMVFTGTPPDDSAPGTVFTRNRQNALERSPKRTLWVEWGITEPPRRGSSFEDVLDLVYQANPSMGYVLDEEYTETEFENGDLLGFSVERLGYWIPRQSAQAAIPRQLWEDSAIEEIGDRYRGKRAFAVKFSPDGSSYALAGCKLGRDGAAVELALPQVRAQGLKVAPCHRRDVRPVRNQPLHLVKRRGGVHRRPVVPVGAVLGHAPVVLLVHASLPDVEKGQSLFHIMLAWREPTHQRLRQS